MSRSVKTRTNIRVFNELSLQNISLHNRARCTVLGGFMSHYTDETRAVSCVTKNVYNNCHRRQKKNVSSALDPEIFWQSSPVYTYTYPYVYIYASRHAEIFFTTYVPRNAIRISRPTMYIERAPEGERVYMATTASLRFLCMYA